MHVLAGKQPFMGTVCILPTGFYYLHKNMYKNYLCHEEQYVMK